MRNCSLGNGVCRRGSVEESREAPALGFKWRGSKEHSDGGMKPSGPGNSLHEHPQGTAHPACLPRLHMAPARSLARCPSATHTQCFSLTSSMAAVDLQGTGGFLWDCDVCCRGQAALLLEVLLRLGACRAAGYGQWHLLPSKACQLGWWV